MECVSCTCYRQSLLSLWKPWWIRLAFGELQLPFPDLFFGLSRVVNFHFSYLENVAVLPMSFWHCSSSFILLSSPANLRDINPDLWGCLGWPLASLPGFLLLTQSIASLCYCLCLARDDLPDVGWWPLLAYSTWAWGSTELQSDLFQTIDSTFD